MTKSFEIIVSDMKSFLAKSTYYELTMYFDAWNIEILEYSKENRRTYFDGLNQVLNKIKILIF